MQNKTKHKFLTQRWHANKRGIDWYLTYEEWLNIWGDKLPSRGKGLGKYCMARFGDIGPYSVDNVYITTNEQNNLDQSLNNHSSVPRKPIVLKYKDGTLKEFVSIGQTAKFFNLKGNGLPGPLKRGEIYRGWQYVRP